MVYGLAGVMRDGSVYRFKCSVVATLFAFSISLLPPPQAVKTKEVIVSKQVIIFMFLIELQCFFNQPFT